MLEPECGGENGEGEGGRKGKVKEMGDSDKSSKRGEEAEYKLDKRR